MGGLTVKKLSAAIAAALALGLCVTPAAHAGKCTGDPVYDPGSNDACNFALAPAMPGAEAKVWGRWFDRQPHIYREYSYVKDTADDGLDAFVWVRFVVGSDTQDKLLARASGPGATAEISLIFAPLVDAFYTRVCVGEGTTNCSAWSR
jgi:hypothetical protein